MSSEAEDLSARFKWPEYLVFGCMLAVSAAIGLFYGCFGGKQKTTSEFLMASRSMSTFPMSMSLIASFMSAITLLGTPVEIYQFGTQYWVIAFSYPLVIASACYLYMPVFFNLQVTSAYEYLEKRFHKSVRLLGSVIFTIQMTIYMAIVVYAPALALSQVTGIGVYVATSAIFIVCIFYTAVGGMKAVMWTDTFQVFVMFGAMVVVIIKGASDIGANEIWEIARNGSRIEFFNFDFDPRTRHTIWGLVIGGYFTWITIYGVNQAQVQRYLTVPTIQQAQRALWINCAGLSVLLTICCYAGLVLYGNYSKCDPLSAKKIATNDQLFPLFVMETLGDIPGMPGLFVAGIFSGALSTVSSGLNSLAAICLEDMVKGLCFKKLSEEQATKISKGLAVAFGLISFGLVFVAAQLGGVLQAALSVFGMAGGPLLGLFTLGMFFPWANTKGALVGTFTALGFMIWLGFGTNIEINRHNLVIPKLEFSVDECPLNSHQPITNQIGKTGGVLEIYRLSYMWYAMIGSNIVVFVGLLVSFLTKAQDPAELNPELISPPVDQFVKYFFPKFRLTVGWDLGSKRRKATLAARETSMAGQETCVSEKAIAYENNSFDPHDEFETYL